MYNLKGRNRLCEFQKKYLREGGERGQVAGSNDHGFESLSPTEGRGEGRGGDLPDF
jgi:hypothetical protein